VQIPGARVMPVWHQPGAIWHQPGARVASG